MLKKLILGTIFVGVIAILVIGAVNRTIDKNGDAAGDHTPLEQARGNSQGLTSQETNVNQGSGYQGRRNGQGQITGTTTSGGYGDANTNGRNNVDVDQAGQGQADVTEWLTLHGIVKSIDETTLLVITDDGVEVTMMGRPWSFAREQGFSASTGDKVSLFGFYENGDFEVGRIDNLTGFQTVNIRQESGRPLWAGGRQS